MLRPAPSDTIFNLWYGMCFTYVLTAILAFILLTFFLRHTLLASDKEREEQVRVAAEAFRENFNKTRATTIDIYKKHEAKYMEYLILQLNPEQPNRNVFGSVLGKIRIEWRKTAGDPTYYFSKILMFCLLSFASVAIAYFIASIAVIFIWYLWDLVFNVYIAGTLPRLSFCIFFIIWLFLFCKGDKRDGIMTLEDMEYYDCGPDDKYKADIYVTIEETDEEEQELEISEGFFRWNSGPYRRKSCNRFIEDPGSHMFNNQQIWVEYAMILADKQVAQVTGRKKKDINIIFLIYFQLMII